MTSTPPRPGGRAATRRPGGRLTPPRSGGRGPAGRAPLRDALTWPKRTARSIVAWAVWSPRRFVIALSVAMTVIGLALTFTLTTVVVSIQTAATDTTPGQAGPQPDSHPGSTHPQQSLPELAAGAQQSYTPAPTLSTAPLPSPTAGAAPDQVARDFVTLWLRGAQRPATQADHDAWVAELTPYGGPALPGQLAGTPYTSIPDATIVSMRIDTLLQSATATLNLSNGQILLVQLMQDPAGWRVHGFHTSA